MIWYKEDKEVLRKQITDERLERFNRGGGAENFLKALIQRQAGAYDVFSPDVDYGIDLIALDRRSVVDEEPKMYFFQVKSTHFKAPLGGGDEEGRPAIPFGIKIAESSLNLMKGRRNFALVVMLYNNEEGVKGGESAAAVMKDMVYPFMDTTDMPLMYFWIDGEDLLEYSMAVNKGKEHDLVADENKKDSPLGTYFWINGNLILPEKDSETQNPYIVLQKEMGERKSPIYYVGVNSTGPDAGSHFSIRRFLESR